MKLRKITPVRWVVLVCLLALAGAGGFLAMDREDGGDFILGSNPELPTLTFYTSGLATTPQLGFWHAVYRGRILEKCNLKVQMWKNLDDLRGALLAGKGDLWLGHTDGFVQAHRRGAPVRLMITSGWRKFYLVSKDPGKVRFSDFSGRSLAFAPPGSPAVPVLEKIMAGRDLDISFASHEPRQLAMKLAKGDLDAALVPEPLVSILTAKMADLAVGENLEAAYGRYRGQDARMPIAGIAVNARTAKLYPDLLGFISDEIMDHSRQILARPGEGIQTLPDRFDAFVPAGLIARSIGRDLIFAARSYDVREEIMDYIDIILPGKNTGKGTTTDLFWR